MYSAAHHGGSAPLYWPAAGPVPHDPAPPVDFRARLGRPLRVRWEGDLSGSSRVARVNREFCLSLLAAGDVELAVAERTAVPPAFPAEDEARFAALLVCRDARLSGPVDVTVRHSSFPSWRRPETRKLVVMQAWPYGHLPREWQEGALQAVDEIWVPSRFSRDVYVRCGVPAERVR